MVYKNHYNMSYHHNTPNPFSNQALPGQSGNLYVQPQQGQYVQQLDTQPQYTHQGIQSQQGQYIQQDAYIQPQSVYAPPTDEISNLANSMINSLVDHVLDYLRINPNPGRDELVNYLGGRTIQSPVTSMIGRSTPSSPSTQSGLLCQHMIKDKNAYGGSRNCKKTPGNSGYCKTHEIQYGQGQVTNQAYITPQYGSPQQNIGPVFSTQSGIPSLRTLQQGGNIFSPGQGSQAYDQRTGLQSMPPSPQSFNIPNPVMQSSPQNVNIPSPVIPPSPHNINIPGPVIPPSPQSVNVPNQVIPVIPGVSIARLPGQMMSPPHTNQPMGIKLPGQYIPQVVQDTYVPLPPPVNQGNPHIHMLDTMIQESQDYPNDEPETTDNEDYVNDEDNV